jgi:hypothetical protein
MPEEEHLRKLGGKCGFFCVFIVVGDLRLGIVMYIKCMDMAENVIANPVSSMLLLAWDRERPRFAARFT